MAITTDGCEAMGGVPVLQYGVRSKSDTWRQNASNFYEEVLMAGGINKVILVGNLGRDPEIRYTADGKPIANFSIATAESWTDKSSGDKREKTEWHRVVVFGRLAEICGQRPLRVLLEAPRRKSPPTTAGADPGFLLLGRVGRENKG